MHTGVWREEKEKEETMREQSVVPSVSKCLVVVVVVVCVCHGNTVSVVPSILLIILSIVFFVVFLKLYPQ